MEHGIFARLGIVFVLLYCVIFSFNSSAFSQTGPMWVVFDKVNSQIVDDHVNCLYADDYGIVWIGTDSGASFCSHGSWNKFVDELAYTIYDNTGSHTMHSVSCITQSSDASVWFGLKGGGISQYDQFSPSATWRRYTTTDGIPYNFILSVDRVPYAGGDQTRGTVWCATIAGVARFTPIANGGGTWQTYTTSSPGCTLPSNNVRAAAFNINDNADFSVWFGTSNPAGAAYCGRSGWQPAILLPAPYDLPITAIAFDASNTAWFAKSQSLSSYNTKTTEWRHYTNTNTSGGLPPGAINAVTIDLKSSIPARWFGTNGGLVQFRDTVWTKFTRLNTPLLPSDTITALTFDRNHNLWIGTPNGVAVYNETGTILDAVHSLRPYSPPMRYALLQNYPNPFNPSTRISYQLPKQSFATLKVFDVLGREIATLVNGEQTAGYKSVSWDAANVPSGMYFYRLQTKEFMQTRKLLLLK